MYQSSCFNIIICTGAVYLQRRVHSALQPKCETHTATCRLVIIISHFSSRSENLVCSIHTLSSSSNSFSQLQLRSPPLVRSVGSGDGSLVCTTHLSSSLQTSETLMDCEMKSGSQQQLLRAVSIHPQAASASAGIAGVCITLQWRTTTIFEPQSAPIPSALSLRSS